MSKDILHQVTEIKVLQKKSFAMFLHEAENFFLPKAELLLTVEYQGPLPCFPQIWTPAVSSRCLRMQK